MVLSYEVPDAKMALATALVDSNAVPMCILNFALLGERPGWSKLLGMALVLLGCSFGFMGKEKTMLTDRLLEA